MKGLELSVTKQNGMTLVHYQLGAADAYDDRVSDKVAQLGNIVPFQYKDEDGKRSITSYVHDDTTLEVMLKRTLKKPEVLAIIKGLLCAFEIGAAGVQISYLVRDTNYIYVDPERFTVKCIMVPLKQGPLSQSEIPDFFRSIVSRMRFDDADKDNYVAQMLTLINTDNYSNLKLKELVDSQMESIGLFYTKEAGIRKNADTQSGDIQNKDVRVNRVGVMNNMRPQGMPQMQPQGMPGMPPMQPQGMPQMQPQGMPGMPPMQPQGMPQMQKPQGAPVPPQGMPGMPSMQPQGMPQMQPQGMPQMQKPQGAPVPPQGMPPMQPQGMPQMQKPQGTPVPPQGMPPMQPQGMPQMQNPQGAPIPPQGMPGMPPMQPQGMPQMQKPQPAPTPVPAPEAPKPQPAPTPVPEAPKPQPAPTPVPAPEAPKPQPTPAPAPEAPKPQPAPQPVPAPEAPKPQPVPAPEAPKPQPAPTPVPTPAPQATPMPNPTPATQTHATTPMSEMPKPEPPKPHGIPGLTGMPLPLQPTSAQTPKPQPMPGMMGMQNGTLVGQLGTKPIPHLVRKSTGEIINITKPEFVIGKSKTKADYAIENNSAISREHCTVVQRDGVNYIKDNNSTNHTYVNGVELQPGKEVLLKHKTDIRMGDEEFTFLLRKGD